MRLSKKDALVDDLMVASLKEENLAMQEKIEFLENFMPWTPDRLEPLRKLRYEDSGLPRNNFNWNGVSYRGAVVYFAYCSSINAVKIGTTINLKMRLMALQTGCPTKLEILTYIPGSYTEERALHVAFKKYWVGVGEWFFYTGQLKEYIESIRATGEYVSPKKRSIKFLPLPENEVREAVGALKLLDPIISEILDQTPEEEEAIQNEMAFKQEITRENLQLLGEVEFLKGEIYRLESIKPVLSLPPEKPARRRSQRQVRGSTKRDLLPQSRGQLLLPGG